MSNMKKIIILTIATLGALVAAVSGLFISFFVVGKKIDKAYLRKENEKN
ncbi:hypothetical protein [Alkalibacterium sp. 20]|nr:hypothetical protein [Alkalibacterium sp. 20]